MNVETLTDPTFLMLLWPFMMVVFAAVDAAVISTAVGTIGTTPAFATAVVGGDGYYCT